MAQILGTTIIRSALQLIMLPEKSELSNLHLVEYLNLMHLD